MRVCHPISRIVVVALAIAIGLPSLPATVSAASDTWSRVTDLERDSRIVVQLQDASSVTGRLVAADRFGLTVRSDGHDEIVPRPLVLKVTVIVRRSSVLLVIGAVAAGLAVSAGIAWACCTNGHADSGMGGDPLALILAVPVAFGVAAGRVKRDDSVRVIYERRGPATQVPSDRGEGSRDRAAGKGVDATSGRDFDPAAWETIQPNLPPSLQGRR